MLIRFVVLLGRKWRAYLGIDWQWYKCSGFREVLIEYLLVEKAGICTSVSCCMQTFGGRVKPRKVDTHAPLLPRAKISQIKRARKR